MLEKGNKEIRDWKEERGRGKCYNVEKKDGRRK